MTQGVHKLDRFDRAILARYQSNTRLVAEEIGAAVGLSAASVQRRIKQLRDGGVIREEIARLDGPALGFALTCIVTVDIDYERAEHINRFKQRMLALPNVQQCYYVTGQWDFILVVTARDMQEYERFTEAALMNDTNVRSFSTHVVMDCAKTGFALPISAQADCR
ncbi:hypothetical protein CAL14_08990 [Bordetella genomosp. 9]|uniref:Lrp/AsnC family transcriptional regulator n=1 Tax=Bordetella genomosp. 9 TaxID=1416803 RepID=UPI000A29669E|nr:Lrp/AsnC family transcriptional regulator [Bordetella genomosp. 9]ARP90408.1 hypothetical protein CAL14_08990 [Bordetella genomosp. 9]